MITKKRKVYFHKNCSDGTVSALVAKWMFDYMVPYFYNIHRITHEISFHEVQYGEKDFEELVPEDGQIFLDITPPRARWEEWKSYKDILCLDHHISAKDIIEYFNDGEFSANFSGAALTFQKLMGLLYENKDYEVFNPEYEYLKELSRLVSIRDTWKKDSEDWEEAVKISEAVQFFGWDNLKDLEIFELKTRLNSIKDILHQKKTKKVKFISEKIFDISNDKYKIAIYPEIGKSISDVAEFLRNKGYDIVFAYSDIFEGNPYPTKLISIRSNDKFDSSKMAESFGGGGHEGAAGFKIKEDMNFVQLVGKLLAYLNN